MPEQSVIVWDLETIPDLEAAARMLDMGHASDAAVREALGPGFPKHPLHKIACIGALVATRQPEGWRIEALAYVGAMKQYLGESWHRFEVATISTVIRIKAIQRLATAA